MYRALRTVQAIDNYKLILIFADGDKRTFDMKKYLEMPPFDKLKDYELFKQARASFDTVEWPDDIDIDPEILLKESKKTA